MKITVFKKRANGLDFDKIRLSENKSIVPALQKRCFDLIKTMLLQSRNYTFEG